MFYKSLIIVPTPSYIPAQAYAQRRERGLICRKFMLRYGRPMLVRAGSTLISKLLKNKHNAIQRHIDTLLP